MTKSRIAIGLAVAVALVGCPAPGGTNKPGGPSPSATKAPGGSTGGSGGTKPGATAEPGGGTPVAAMTPQPGAIVGRVLGLDGSPAAGVTVRGYVIANNGATLVSNNSGNLIANNSSKLRLSQAQAKLEVKTDAQGVFRLASPDGSPLNVEASQTDEVKAFRGEAAAGQAIELKLDFTGRISGRVTKADDASVKNFEGVDVFVPGTPYIAKCDADGNYVLLNVPVGTYKLVASKEALGRAELPAVTVSAKAETKAADLAMTLAKPSLAKVEPANAGEGATVRLLGENFRITEGGRITVTFNGVIATAVKRIDDRTLEVVVPPKARSGELVATVNGVVSNGVPFKVIGALTLEPNLAEIIVGGTQTFTAVAKDEAGQGLAGPVVTWTAEGDAIAVTPAGVVTARAAGSATLKAASGSVVAQRVIQVREGVPAVETLAGSGTSGYLDGPAKTAQLGPPGAIAADAAGNVYFVDGKRLRMVTAAGEVKTLAGAAEAGATDGAGASARFTEPSALALDGGRLLVADGRRLRAVDLAGADRTVSTLAGGENDGDNDGAVAQATFRGISGLAVGPDGTIYIADNHAIRVLSKGQVSTLAGEKGTSGFKNAAIGGDARFNSPYGLAVAGGTLYVADRKNHRVRTVDLATSEVKTLAGTGTPAFVDGPAATAQLHDPYGLAIDRDNFLFVGDSNNHRIRKIALKAPDMPVSTVAGTGVNGGDDGLPISATLSYPGWLAFGGKARLYWTDEEHFKVRTIAP